MVSKLIFEIYLSYYFNRCGIFRRKMKVPIDCLFKTDNSFLYVQKVKLGLPTGMRVLQASLQKMELKASLFQCKKYIKSMHSSNSSQYSYVIKTSAGILKMVSHKINHQYCPALWHCLLPAQSMHISTVLSSGCSISGLAPC